MAKLHTYVLMDVQLHLLVEKPKANLSELMRDFNVAYTGITTAGIERQG